MRKITKKNIRFVNMFEDGSSSFEEAKLFMSFAELKLMGAKRRYYPIAQETYYLIVNDYTIIF